MVNGTAKGSKKYLSPLLKTPLNCSILCYVNEFRNFDQDDSIFQIIYKYNISQVELSSTL